jgi:chromosome partitioning protein
MKIIALVNHKGGVAKTTSAINIAAGMALKGFRVLAVDLDPQANMTKSFGVHEPSTTIYDSFYSFRNKDKSTVVPLPLIEIKKNLKIVPSTVDFAAIEVELVREIFSQKVLKTLLKPLENDFDYCILDCPPSLSLITVNALVACNEVLVPMSPEYFSYVGLDTIIGIIRDVKENLNENISLKGIFLTRYDSKKLLTKEIKAHLQKISQNGELIDVEIRTCTPLAECQLVGKDIFEYKPLSNGAADYEKLVKVILN